MKNVIFISLEINYVNYLHFLISSDKLISFGVNSNLAPSFEAIIRWASQQMALRFYCIHCV